MRRSHNPSAIVYLMLVILTGLLLGYDPGTPRGPHADVGDKWDLWIGGPHLRGANIWQAIVIPELDGSEFKGPGPVGPPYAQEDFDRLLKQMVKDRKFVAQLIDRLTVLEGFVEEVGKMAKTIE